VPTPAASPTPTVFAATGQVVDDAGLPIAGAVVVASYAATIVAVPPPVGSGVPQAVTGADGRFTVTGLSKPSKGLAVEVFGAVNRPILHAKFTATSALADLGTLKLTTLSADELAWLNDPAKGINADRARYGVAPLVFDEYNVEAARFWASSNVSGSVGIACPHA